MRELIEKANILQEALPYIRRFAGTTFVIKYGGHAMVDEALSTSFARDITLLKFVGIHPVVVHGGGPQIDATLASMGVVSERIDGIRVTDERTMEVVEMVLAGRLNGQIISLIAQHGGRAVGLSGRDDRFLRARKSVEMKTKKGDLVDPGRVGEMIKVEPEILKLLTSTGFIPVVAPVAVDDAGEALNINADFVASAIAAALGAEKLVLMTDIEGIRDHAGALVPSLDKRAVLDFIERGVIQGGMIPKARCALEAIEAGVGKVHVIDGRTEHAVLLEIFTDSGVGTEIVAGAAGHSGGGPARLMGPLAWPIAAALSRFQGGAVPPVAHIDSELASRAGVRFVPAEPRPRRRVALDRSRLYDARITQAREVPTREGNLHDFMNALVWASFPRAKMSIHQRQYALIESRIEGARLPEHRTPEQDMLAMVDEGGIALLTTDKRAVEAATQNRDADALARMVASGDARPAVFGHALFEHLARKDVTVVWGRAMVLQALDLPSTLQATAVDARLAEAIATREVDRDVGSAPLLSSVLTCDAGSMLGLQ